MLLRIMYDGKEYKEYDTIKDVSLNELITSSKIINFYPSTGLVVIGCDSIRGNGDGYKDSEKCETYLEALIKYWSAK